MIVLDLAKNQLVIAKKMGKQLTLIVAIGPLSALSLPRAT